MEISRPLPEEDALSSPLRARLFGALTDLRRPATTQELADLVGRHPNTVRRQLQRLATAGVLECRSQSRPRGRPRHVWAILPAAQPGGRAPEAHGNLSRWLARAMAGGDEALARVEQTGVEIGRELAPRDAGGELRDAMQDALTALGFAPRVESAPGRLRFILANCPYRSAVAENPAVVCTLHRGITRGLLERLDPGTRLTNFVAREPFQAGCLVELAGAGAT